MRHRAQPFQRAILGRHLALLGTLLAGVASFAGSVVASRALGSQRLTLLGLALTSLLLICGLTGFLHRAYRLLRRQAESERAAETAQILQHILDSAPYAIVAGDTRTGTKLFNRAAERITGYRASEVVGKLLPQLIHDGQELADRAAALTQELGRPVLPQEALIAKARLGLPDEHEWTYIRKDGERVPVLISMSALRGSSASPTAFMGVAQDISERKRAEAELRRTNVALGVAKEAAEAADRIKSAFLATMSHELRTPLNSIIGFTGILLQGLPGALNAEQRKQLGMVQASARHLLALINDILDISKIEAGQLAIHPAAFDLRASLSKVADLVQAGMSATPVELRVQLAPEIGLWHGDQRRIEQVVLNLLNNAFKFTERGEVTLRAQRVDAWVEIAVSDTGIGIQEQQLGGLFEPFKQIDSQLSRSHEGTGLGLAICRRLVQLMGGDIRVASQWGAGSVFAIQLPSHAPRAERVEAAMSERRVSA